MKHLRFTAVLCSAALALLVGSCGGAGDKSTPAADTSATKTDTATKEPEKPAPVNTIDTTTTHMAVIIHKVKDYSKWMTAYEADDSARTANGLHNYVIGRGYMDTSMVMVALKVDDVAKAKAFSKNPHLKAAMQKAGVVGQPEIAITTTNWQDTATLTTTLRSRVLSNVKDWATWLKSFEDGKQERMDNGVVDRIVGHDADDTKKVFTVTAVTDTAKAFAYYKSDALKQRRAAGGVIGEPTRFLFNIVKRYRK
ncbi:MAG: hypothetical protein QM764_18520 [Chitinophagaceae bacterium]